MKKQVHQNFLSHLLKALSAYVLLNTVVAYAAGGDPFIAELTRASQSSIGWFTVIGTGVLTINLLLFAICQFADFEWTKNLKPKVTKSLFATVLIFLIAQFFSGSVSTPLQSLQTCPLSLLGLHC